MATQRLARRLLPRFVDLLNDSSADVPTEAMIDTSVDWAGFQFSNYTIVAPYQFIRFTIFIFALPALPSPGNFFTAVAPLPLLPFYHLLFLRPYWIYRFLHFPFSALKVFPFYRFSAPTGRAFFWRPYRLVRH